MDGVIRKLHLLSLPSELILSENISDDKNWLKRLTVTTSGEIIFKGKRKLKEPIAPRISFKKYRKTLENNIKEDKDNENIVNSEEVDGKRMEKVIQDLTNFIDVDFNEDSASQKTESSNTIQHSPSKFMIDNNLGAFLEKVKELLTLINVEVPNMSSEMKKLIQDINIFFIRSVNVNVVNDFKVELQPNSGVYINSTELYDLQQLHRKPNEMVRRLLRRLIGEEKLQNMSAKGKGIRKGIPVPILRSVEWYVNQNCVYPLDNPEFIRLINGFCSSLRYKKKMYVEKSDVSNNVVIKKEENN